MIIEISSDNNRSTIVLYSIERTYSDALNSNEREILCYSSLFYKIVA